MLHEAEHEHESGEDAIYEARASQTKVLTGSQTDSPKKNSESQKEGQQMSTMYWLLLSAERLLTSETRALPIRCRELLKQLQQHGQLLKQQLRNAQKATFLDVLLEAFTNVDQETRKEVEDIYAQLDSAVDEINSEQKRLETRRIKEGADLKAMEQKQQRFDMALKSCLTAIHSESHWLGTLRSNSEGGHVESMRVARQKLLELGEKRPFPMLKNCREVGSGGGRKETSALLGLGPSPSRGGPADGMDADMVIETLQEPVLAARSLGRTIQQWQTLAVKRANQVAKVKQERSNYITGRQRAQEARRGSSSPRSYSRTMLLSGASYLIVGQPSRGCMPSIQQTTLRR